VYSDPNTSQQDDAQRNPTAVGLVRADISGLHAPRHAAEIRRHADQLGYCYLYTVQPPHNSDDPVGYALGITAGLDAAALVVYDLATIDHTPGRVAEVCDLETLHPPATWAAAPPGGDPAHAHPDHPLTVAEAHHLMREHLDCSALACPRKASALTRLVRAGKLVPPVSTPRERAAARGLPFPPATCELPVRVGANTRILRDVLDGLDGFADPSVAARAVADRPAPGSPRPCSRGEWG
jgi:hypothetical protein